MTTHTIMFHIGNRAWTLETLHSACALARQTDAEIALVKTIPVQHLSWLGTDCGYRSITEREMQDLHDYDLTLEDYGIPHSVNLMQYATLLDALVEAAGHLKAQIVFAQMPPSRIPFWHQIQTGMLRHRLARQQRQLYEQPSARPESPVEELALTPQP
jgi:hypothetical protein